jgi:O-antigen ligase
MRKGVYWISIALVFSLPWENLIMVPGFGTMTRVLGMLLAGTWVISAVIEGEFRRPQAFHLVACAFAGWNMASVLWTLDMDKTLNRATTYVQIIALILILWDLYGTRAALRGALQAWVLGSYVSVASVVGMYRSGVEAMYRRYSASGFNPNDIAVIFALGLPVAWFLATEHVEGKRGRVLQLVNLAYVPAGVFAMLLTGTRAALLASVPAIVYMLGSSGRLRPALRVAMVVVLIGAVLGVVTLIPQATLQRLSTVGTSITTGDIGGRAAIWKESLGLFADRPFTGVGSGAHERAAVKTSKVAHNVFLSVLAELGVVGFALFVSVLAITVYQAARQDRRMMTFWLTVLLTWAIGVLTVTWEHRKQTWLFLSLVVVSAAIPRAGRGPVRGVASQADDAPTARRFPFSLGEGAT